MRIIAMSCISLSLVACAADLKPLALADADREHIKAQVKRQLKDPGSAQFGEIVAGTDSRGTSYACGWINAKNSFGGYTGQQPFVGKLEDGPGGRTFRPLVVGGSDADRAAARISCAKILPGA